MSLMKRMVSGLKDVSYWIIPLICRIAAVVPKKRNLWVFGCWAGRLYADNAKYEFEYVNGIDTDVRAVWISRDKGVVQAVRAKGYEAYARHSLKGVWCCLRAEAAFMTEDRHDISRILISGARLIQLWHVMGIKDITSFFPADESRARRAYTEATHSHVPEYWMTACPDANKKYREAFNLNPERMFITGQPKDDTFIVNTRNDFIDGIRAAHPGCKVACYLPTHRYFGQHNQSPMLSIDALKRANALLKDRNIVMVFKPHMHEFELYRDLDANALSNIVFAVDPTVFGDVYQFLPACDALITDYSGIMLGYLTGERPIVYFAYDYDDYIKDDAGFYFPYREVVSGPVCKTWEETVAALAGIFEKDEYAQLRAEKRARFSPYNDGLNRKRVYDTVRGILRQKA